MVWLLSAPSRAGSKKLKEILKSRGRTKAGKEKRRKWKRSYVKG